MSARTERWIYVGACLVLYALAMTLVTWATKAPTRWIIDALNASFGAGWAGAIIAAPPLAGLVWAMWPDPSYTPPPAANTRFPRWVRIIGNAYLAIMGLALAIGLATIILFVR